MCGGDRKRNTYKEETLMKVGKIVSWNPQRGCGTVSAEDGCRYFLWSSRVIEGPEPRFGDGILFEVDPRPVKEGRLPIACKVIVVRAITDVEIAIEDVLSGKEPNGGAQ
jgi:hypothetical protein